MANGLLPKVVLVFVLVAIALGIASLVLNIIILTKENARQSGTTTTSEQSGTTKTSEQSGTTKMSEQSGTTKTSEQSGTTTTSEQSGTTTTSEQSGTTKTSEQSGTTITSEQSGTTTTSEQSGTTTTGTTAVPIKPTPKPTISKSPGFKAAADNLLKGLDFNYDPCNNFYKFTCNKFITSPDQSMGTFQETEIGVLEAIAETLSTTKQPTSTAEIILLKVFDSCVHRHGKGKATSLHRVMKDLFSGFPMLESNWNESTLSDTDFWRGIGTLELQYGMPSLLNSYVSIDEKNITGNALYIDQIPLSMPRDFYVKPQFLNILNKYLEKLIAMTVIFSFEIQSTASYTVITEDASEATRLELQLALASVPGALLRNYEEQYNVYNIEQLVAAYPSIGWKAYLGALLERPVQSTDEFNIDQRSYLGTLNTILAGKQFSKRTFVNFIAMRFLQANLGFLRENANEYEELLEFLESVKPNRKKQHSSTTVSKAALGCVELTMQLIPFATGYTYMKGIDAKLRDDVQEDVRNITSRVIEKFLEMISTLSWLTKASLGAANNKANDLIKNYGWPYWFDFNDSTTIDEYHKNYEPILQLNDWWDILNALQYSNQLTENFGNLEKKPDRRSFEGSPATVNAWYQPQRNSITIPFAILNSPIYRHDFPQAYKYGGMGAIVGHELTHGYDDEGVQFGPDGALSSCTWNHCGWMDNNSTLGFINMAQCVVSQYSEKCCPLKTGNVHCASGERTQGENIADIGGRLAAHKAYRHYVAVDRKGVEEDRLPGLEQFTPNQIFWITLGRLWCQKTDNERLIMSLMTDPHPPGVCRVNQVVQDVPEFGQDFNCPRGASMYPLDTQRCHVWSGQ